MQSQASSGAVVGLSLALGAGAATAAEVDLSLTHLDRIELAEAGLREPSGLALAPGGKALWAVDDDQGKVFEL